MYIIYATETQSLVDIISKNFDEFIPLGYTPEKYSGIVNGGS